MCLECGAKYCDCEASDAAAPGAGDRWRWTAAAMATTTTLAAPAPTPTAGGARGTAATLRELQALTPKQLRERAVSDGVDTARIEEARDQEQPKPALIALIQRATAPPPPTASYSHHELRLELIATARQMNTTGINQGTSGNVSIRVSDGVSEGFLITPSGLPYDTMLPEQLVYMDLDSAGYYGEHLPSSEWRMVRAPGPGQAPAPRWHCLRFLWLDTHVPPPEQHLDIYRARPAAKAILHAHPTYCTALAALHLEIPAFHYMVGAAGGKKIPCARPATASSERTVGATVCWLCLPKAGWLRACAARQAGGLRDVRHAGAVGRDPHRARRRVQRLPHGQPRHDLLWPHAGQGAGVGG